MCALCNGTLKLYHENVFFYVLRASQKVISDTNALGARPREVQKRPVCDLDNPRLRNIPRIFLVYWYRRLLSFAKDSGHGTGDVGAFFGLFLGCLVLPQSTPSPCAHTDTHTMEKGKE